MSRSARLSVQIAVAVSLSACQVGPQLAPLAPRDYFISARPERVWAALLLTYTDLNVPIETMEKASFFLRSGEFTLAPADAAATMDCGTYMGNQNAGRVAVYVRVTTLLRDAGDSTAVRLSVQARGWDQAEADLQAEGNMFATDPNESCVSNGELERRIIGHIEEHIPSVP